MIEEKRETTFENAKAGDRVYSPIFKCKNPDDKTNCVISEIKMDEIFPLKVRGDTEGMVTLKMDGSYGLDCNGQILFWENPIKEIPTRPKRRVKKTGYIGINPEYPNVGERIALTSNIYCTRKAIEIHNANIGSNYQIKEIEFETEE